MDWSGTARRVRAITAVLAAVAVLVPGAAAAAGPPAPFGHDCTAENGVRYCPTTTLAQRVPTFDGVPLDADVTLPPTGNGPFPAIVMLHGWGGSKDDFESSSPAGHCNNNYYAKQRYAVLNYTACGWGNSCGAGPSGDHSGA